MRNNTNTPIHHTNEQGLVSIIVTSVLMIVVTLIALSYATVIRREQVKQLDRQLSSRAFYAAESGVNLAVDKIKNANFTANKSSCGTLGGTFQASDLVIDANTQTEISCLLIDQTPQTLEYSSIGEESRVMSFTSANGTPINTVTFSWQLDNTTATTPAGCATRPPNGFPDGATQPWSCGHPLLRVDLVPTEGALDRNAMQAAQFVGFLYPRTSGTGSVGPYAVTTGNGNNKGRIIDARCNTTLGTNNPRICTATISGLNARTYSARVTSIYGNSQLSLFAIGGGSRLALSGGQVVIDSTAKAAGVLRRIQVRKTIDGTDASGNVFVAPGFGLEVAGELCKQYLVTDRVQDLCDGSIINTSVAVGPCIAVPRDIVLVMDASASMSNNNYSGIGALREAVQRSAAIDFINKISLSNTTNQLGIVQFSDSVVASQALTTNRTALINATADFGNAPSTHYNTALLGAETILNGSGSRVGVEKVIIFMSDGRPNDLGDSTQAEINATTGLVMGTVNRLGSSGYFIYSLAVDYNTNGTDVLAVMPRPYDPANFYNAAVASDLSTYLQSIASKFDCVGP